MKIMYVSVHQILEDDEVRLFKALGHDVFCLGSNGKNGSIQSFRPPILFNDTELAMYDQFERMGGRFVFGDVESSHVPNAFMDLVDAVIIMHSIRFVEINWKALSRRHVILRKIGQTIDDIQAATLPYEEAGLKVIAYSPMELRGFEEDDADVIRFYKSSETYKPSFGSGRKVLTFANFYSQRYPHDYLDYLAIVEGFEAVLGGYGNEEFVNSIGMVSWERQISLLKEARCYLYASGLEIPYTLNFIEAWMTGTPIVVFAPQTRIGKAFEITSLISNAKDGFICSTISEARETISRLLSDYDEANRVGLAGRARALELFGEPVKMLWKSYFERLQRLPLGNKSQILSRQDKKEVSTMKKAAGVFEVLQLLTPYDIDLTKRRVGGERDGGYVICEFDSRPDVISFGVGPDVSFEIEMADFGHNVYLHDHTVPHLPENHKRFSFARKGISGTNPEAPDLAPLNKHLDAIPYLTQHLILKIDVEGAEWDVFSSVDDYTLDRFDLIVIELHWLENLNSVAFRQKAYAALSKLRQQFTIFHVHANNCADIHFVEGLPVVSVLEISMVRSTLVRRRRSTTVYPSSLDKGNDINRRDHLLLFFPFLPCSVEPEHISQVVHRVIT